METLTRREREKKMREEEMIRAAERIFCLKGFDDASMDEIAREAQFTKRTLYQYFENKEDLYFAVVLRSYQKLHQYLQEGSKCGNNGYMKLCEACKGYFRFYKENFGAFRLMSYISHVKRKSTGESKWRRELLDYNKGIFSEVALLINEGKEDGSIRKEVMAEKAAFSLVFLMTGFLNQLAASGDTFTQYLSLDFEDFSLFSMELIMKSLREDSK